MSSIKRQLISGSIYIAIAKYSGVIVNIIVIAILARLIDPAEFALVSIITVISNFFVLFSDFGIAAAIIQKQNLTKTDINNIFSYCCYLGVVIALVFIGFSYLLVKFYDSMEIGSLSRLLSIQILFSSFNIVPNALVLKRKEFKFIAIRTIIIHILTGCAACIAAINGWGIYSLLVNPISSSILIFAFNYLKTAPLKFNLKPCFYSLKLVLNYSIYNLGYNIINYMSRNFDKLLIGKLLPLTQLGYYEKSYSLMMQPVQNVISIINPVIHPVLSKYQDNAQYIYSLLKKAVSIFAWIGFPLSVILSIYGKYIILLFLGKTWLPAVQTFQIFALSIGFQLIYALQGPFFLIRNKPKIMMNCGLFTAVINILALVCGLIIFHKIEGIAIFICIAYMLTFIVTFYFLIRSCFKGFGSYDIFHPLFIPLCISILVLICCNLAVTMYDSYIFTGIIVIPFTLFCSYKVFYLLKRARK